MQGLLYKAHPLLRAVVRAGDSAAAFNFCCLVHSKAATTRHACIGMVLLMACCTVQHYCSSAEAAVQLQVQLLETARLEQSLTMSWQTSALWQHLTASAWCCMGVRLCGK